jgi:hypothetical protein
MAAKNHRKFAEVGADWRERKKLAMRKFPMAW